MNNTLYRLVYLSRNNITGGDHRLQEEISDRYGVSTAAHASG
nr:hypothetical protein [uncultured Halomonas sp.]